MTEFTNTMLPAALWYASKGYQIAPVEITLHGRGDKTKKQIFSRTTWGEHATSDTETINKWYSDSEMQNHPNQGILIATGERSNLLVLDADNLSQMDDLMEEHGVLPKTFTVKSQSGSTHYYFKFPTGRIQTDIDNWGTTAGLVDKGMDYQTGRQGVGIDLRGNGGAIFAPPTKTYQYGKVVGEYTVTDTSEPAELPQWVIDLYESRAKKSRQGDRPRPKAENWESETGEITDAHERTTAFILKQAEEQFQDIMDRGWGAQWDNEVTRVMGILVRLVNSPWSEFEESDLDIFLKSYAPEDDNFSEREWDRIKNSCFRMADGDILDPFEDETIDPALMEWAMNHAAKKDQEKVAVEEKRTDLEGPFATLPEEFWNARPLFQQIRQNAWYRIESADATFHAFTAAYMARVPWQYQCDTGMNVPAQPIYSVIIAAGPGEGKGGATALGFELARNELDDMPVGTGEGLAEYFLELQVDEDDQKNFKSDGSLVANPTKKKVQVRHNLLVNESEGSNFVNQMNKPNSTLAPQVLSFAVGEKLGQMNAYAESKRRVNGHSYAGGFVVGAQYGPVGEILARGNVGLSQRFMWSAVIDPFAKDLPEAPVAPVFHEALPVSFPYKVNIEIDPSITAPMREEKLKLRLGQTVLDPQDTHRIGILLRTSMALRLMDGPNLGITNEQTGEWVPTAYQITVEDWRLANILYDTSKKVRQQLAARAMEEVATKQVEAGRNDAIRRVAASDTEGTLRMDTAKEKVLTGLSKMETKGVKATAGAFTPYVTKSYRTMIPDALTELVADGLVSYDEESKAFSSIKKEASK